MASRTWPLQHIQIVTVIFAILTSVVSSVEDAYRPVKKADRHDLAGGWKRKLQRTFHLKEIAMHKRSPSEFDVAQAWRTFQEIRKWREKEETSTASFVLLPARSMSQEAVCTGKYANLVLAGSSAESLHNLAHNVRHEGSAETMSNDSLVSQELAAFVQNITKEVGGAIVDEKGLAAFIPRYLRIVTNHSFQVSIEELFAASKRKNSWLSLSEAARDKLLHIAYGEYNYPHGVGHVASIAPPGLKAVAHVRNKTEVAFFIERYLRYHNFTSFDPQIAVGLAPWYSGDCASASFPRLERAVEQARKNGLLHRST